MMQRLYEQFYSGRVGVALLLLRVVAGLAFVFHGWPKVADVHAFAEPLKLPLWLAGVAAYTELVGGILLILGLLTPVAALFIGIEMLVALFRVHIPAGQPFVNPAGPSYEMALLYLGLMMAFLLAGPGAYSLDAVLMKNAAISPVGRRRGVA